MKPGITTPAALWLSEGGETEAQPFGRCVQEETTSAAGCQRKPRTIAQGRKRQTQPDPLPLKFLTPPCLPYTEIYATVSPEQFLCLLHFPNCALKSLEGSGYIHTIVPNSINTHLLFLFTNGL